jgi:hypothetical protein
MISLSRRKPVGEAAPTTSPWILSSVRDTRSFDQRCSMCERHDLRVTFEVQMVTSDAACTMCERCLSKQAIALEVGGEVLHGEELRRQLSELAIRVMHRTCRDVLRALLASTTHSGLPEAAVFFDRNAQLSPRHAAALFLVLSTASPDTDPRIFEVQMRCMEHRQEFGRLSEAEKLAVWPALSLTVRKSLFVLGLAPKLYVQPQGKRANASRFQHKWDVQHTI